MSPLCLHFYHCKHPRLYTFLRRILKYIGSNAHIRTKSKWIETRVPIT